MQVTCQTNTITILPRKLQGFAFTQNDKGVVDLTQNKKYIVFGLRKNKQGTFYLILTDSIHNALPWWMPAGFFTQPEGATPKSWQTRTWGRFSKDIIQSHPVYFDVIDDIEDGTQKGAEAFCIMTQDNESQI